MVNCYNGQRKLNIIIIIIIIIYLCYILADVVDKTARRPLHRRFEHIRRSGTVYQIHTASLFQLDVGHSLQARSPPADSYSSRSSATSTYDSRSACRHSARTLPDEDTVTTSAWLTRHRRPPRLSPLTLPVQGDARRDGSAFDESDRHNPTERQTTATDVFNK